MSLDVTLSNPPCGTCGHVPEGYSDNITHNLNTMAQQAGIYMQVWRPEECGIKTASQLIEPLTVGIALLKSDPERFKKFDSSNGWGLYENFVPWLERYLEACINNPNAEVSADR